MIIALVLSGLLVANPPKIPHQAKNWSFRSLTMSGFDSKGFLGENKYLPPYTVTEDGVIFRDGSQEGIAKWTIPSKSFKEGDTITVTVSVKNMQAKFKAQGAAEGIRDYEEIAIHPFKPPQSDYRTISFKFKHSGFQSDAYMSFTVNPTMSSQYNSSGVTVAWRFGPGGADKQVTTSMDPYVSVIDATNIIHKRPENLSDPVEVSMAKLVASENTEVKGVACDGVSLLMVRSVVDAPGTVTFNVKGGGAVYPSTFPNPFGSTGFSATAAKAVPIGPKRYVATAVYRPPSWYGAIAEKRKAIFDVAFKPDGEGKGSNGEKSIDLVPPPIVLVHGTYDAPKTCYEVRESADNAPTNLAPRLRAMGYQDVFCVDWEETNGNKDPSSFVTNEKAVFSNKDGIEDALKAMRKRSIAVTQADLVCHSQGGVISRVFARGFSLRGGELSNHPEHYSDPMKCRLSGCWYHTLDNFGAGYIHRLVTISSTHKGSDVCRLFKAFKNADPSGDNPIRDALFLNIFTVAVDNFVSAITTGGFLDQTPGSPALKAIGPTPIPSHAIACTATDEDMYSDHKVTSGPFAGVGDYYAKLLKIFLGTPRESKAAAFDWLADEAAQTGDQGPRRNSETYKELVGKYMLSRATADDLKPVIFQIRKTVFMDDENDCTVSMKSSFGGLTSPYVTKAEHVLHGWAPRYKVVQDKVIDLLQNDGSMFDSNGFPDPYTGRQSAISSVIVPIPGPRSPTPLSSSASSTLKSEAASWSGLWDVNNGFIPSPFTLIQVGNEVTGTYMLGKSTFKGTTNGRVLRFKVKDDLFRAEGEGELTLSEDGKSFTGSYFISGATVAVKAKRIG